MNSSGKTDIGRCRSSNQDSFLIRQIGAMTLGVVCDGMGGANGGNVASALAANTFADVIGAGIVTFGDTATDEELTTLLREALDAANEAVYGRAKADERLAGMGTTLCAVLTDGEHIHAVNVGDSRMYYFTDDGIVQLSHDHSFVQALVDTGSITPEEARTHPNKNIITRAVGTAITVEGDYYDMDFPGKAMLLCSDGLTNFVEDERLYKLYAEAADVGSLTDAYVAEANENGGGDNITALVMQK